MKLKVFGPEQDLEGGGSSMTALAFTFSGPARVEIELEDGTKYSIKTFDVGSDHYIQIDGPKGTDLMLVPIFERSILIGSTSRLT